MSADGQSDSIADRQKMGADKKAAAENDTQHDGLRVEEESVDEGDDAAGEEPSIENVQNPIDGHGTDDLTQTDDASVDSYDSDRGGVERDNKVFLLDSDDTAEPPALDKHLAQSHRISVRFARTEDTNTQESAGDHTVIKDERGRIQRVEAELRLASADKPNAPLRKSVRTEATDDAGHLIARAFGGQESADNLVSMNRRMNQNHNWKRMEKQWIDALKNGSSVNISLEITYNGEDRRPGGFIVSWQIDDAARKYDYFINHPQQEHNFFPERQTESPHRRERPIGEA